MEALVQQEKKGNNFSKEKTKFCLSLHYNSGNTCLLINEKETYKFKASNKNNSFPSHFYLGKISNKIDYAKSEEVSLKEICMIFELIMILLINLTF